MTYLLNLLVMSKRVSLFIIYSTPRIFKFIHILDFWDTNESKNKINFESSPKEKSPTFFDGSELYFYDPEKEKAERKRKNHSITLGFSENGDDEILYYSQIYYSK